MESLEIKNDHNGRGVTNDATNNATKKSQGYLGIKDKYGQTPSKILFGAKNDNVMKFIEYELRVVPGLKTFLDFEPLILASAFHESDMLYCFERYPNIANCIINNKAFNVNVQDEEGKTALHHAAAGSCITLIIGLLRLKADVQIQDKDNKTPAQIFFNKKNINFNDFLEEDFDVIKPFFLSLKHELIYNMGVNSNFAKLVLKLNIVDVNLQDDKGRTALHYALGHGDAKNILFLLQQKADVCIQDKEGFVLGIPIQSCLYPNDESNTALESFEENMRLDENKNILKPLLQSASVAKQHLPAILGRYRLLTKFFLKYKIVDVNCRDHQGRTALHYAAKFIKDKSEGGFSKLRKLLFYKADVNIKDNDGRIPAQILFDSENEEFIERMNIYLKQDKDTHFSETFLKLILSIGPYKNEAIVLASRYRYIASCLFEYNAVSVNDQDHEGKTALHHACERAVMAPVLNKSAMEMIVYLMLMCEYYH